MVEIDDREVAVLIDSVDHMREHLLERGIPTPSCNTLLLKINMLMTPDTDKLYITKEKP